MNPIAKGRQIVQRWSDRWRRGAFILLYHRVDQAGDDPFDIRVTPERFTEHLEVLRERWRVVPLRDLVHALREGESVEGSVAVTFDDGYEDNLRVALPALERADVPATVFVVSNELGREFWWDGLTRLWASRRGEGGSAEFRALHRRLRGGDREARARALDELAAEPPLQAADAGERARALTADELRALADGGLVEIGSHTRSHPFLPDLGESAQREEIIGARDALEAVIERTVVGMSYPFGGFDGRSLALVEEAGMDYACAAAPGVCTVSSGVHHLPRFWVGDWTGEELDEYLRARSPGSAASVPAAV